MVKGADYDRLLAEFIEKGGDLSLCPFDAPGYKWADPPHHEIASDSDWDPVVEEAWREIQKEGVAPGIPMTDEEWIEVDLIIDAIERRRDGRPRA